MKHAKLTDAEVLLLRARKARGEDIIVKDEATRFACGVETIRKILRGDTFRHLLAESVTSPLAAEPTEAEMAASLSAFLSQVKTPSDTQEADIQALLGNPGGIH